nr:MAG TPA: hypothetical protein [Caudoviricetes sp.]
MGQNIVFYCTASTLKVPKNVLFRISLYLFIYADTPLDSFELNPRKCLKMRCFRGFFLLKITIRRKSVGYFARS